MSPALNEMSTTPIFVRAGALQDRNVGPDGFSFRAPDGPI
jgi:hypothetical protein